MPVREEITYILVHDRMPYHRKIRGLSDGAFRLLIECWCWCGENVETNGVMPADVWATMRTPKARKDLLEKKLVKPVEGEDAYQIHDWLDIQRSAAEVEALRAQKSKAGQLGNHRRHHAAKGIVAPDCALCRKEKVA